MERPGSTLSRRQSHFELVVLACRRVLKRWTIRPQAPSAASDHVADIIMYKEVLLGRPWVTQ